ncbi:tRNA epoxyqueuosine(34) reductase QueG [Anoxybacter fermentans]|uniref:tRNA epoxyqueuosine(34) reductase QueG n=1 Tax=Anoxybacter fermentans TaxID=1323375 RepID=A0A3Q9HRA3_9FIRM|nr:tRNA epoxyqueuosine(34) reductase QueG [Anoxybacter fermentans]AZR73830.1 tRNA epoxyqueuosine(34) reductase QueG [Anoxybacter fermentans]
MTFEERLKKYAKEIGIDLIGITTAKPFYEAYNRLEKMKRLGYLSPWTEMDFKKRCFPKLLMKDAASLIAVGISYLVKEDDGEEDDKTLFYGKLARFAQFEDYHKILRSKMEELVSFIKKKYPEVKAKIFVDTGPLIDREVAYRAGLGFFGKNSALINPEYGSFLALGEILLNIPLKPDKPMKNGCGDCILCLKACPQQAIKAPGEIQTNECLSHYTQEKGLFNEKIRRKLGLRLWGCDTCQEVCPYNQKARPGSGIFKVHKLGKKPDLEQILKLSNREYRKLVGETAMAWRGKRILQRNALINLGNLKDPHAISILKEALKDPRPIIRGAAAWAIGEIGGKEAKTILARALQKEKDEQVREELRKGLEKIL